jgi:histidinol-phosphate aminotransferase
MMGNPIRLSKLESLKNYEVHKENYNIKLDANESFLAPPKRLLDKFKEILSDIEINRYPDSDSEQLRKLYAQFCNVKESNVIVGNGSDELIHVIINGVLKKGEKILTLKPDFSMYKFYTSLIEGNVIELELDENMKISTDRIIEKAAEEDVKIIIFSNPNNPTGSVLPNEEILKIVKGSNALVVVDEAYNEFYGQTMIDNIDEFDNLVVLRTASKAIGLAAARLGFLIAREELIFKIIRAKSPFNVNGLTQALGEIVLSERGIISENVRNIISEREYLFNQLIKIEEASADERLFKVYPTEANFVYLKTEKAEEIHRKLLDMSISIRIFNSENLRITVGSHNENKVLITALNRILEVR